MFGHYSLMMEPSRNALAEGNPEKANLFLPRTGSDKLLNKLEQGRTKLLSGEAVESKSAFEDADKIVKVEQGKALLQVSSGFEQVGSVLINDNVIDYSAADYELGFLHFYQGLNYLQSNNLEAALVEMRRANQVQERAKLIREKRLNSIASQIKDKGLTENVGALLARYPDAGGMLGSVQNATLFYFSALLYEAENNLNDAFIDFSRALAVVPENQYVAQALMRVAQKQGRRDALKRLEAIYGKLTLPKTNQGQLVVLSEQGVVHAKQSWKFPFYVSDENGNAALLSLALPYFKVDNLPPTDKMVIDKRKVSLSLLTNVDLMAEQALREEMPTIVLRQILRSVSKYKINQAVAESDPNGVGSALTNMLTVMTDQPDTRHWQTLPESISLFNGYYPKGDHAIVAGNKLINVTIQPNRTTLLWVSHQGENTTYWQGVLGDI